MNATQDKMVVLTPDQAAQVGGGVPGIGPVKPIEVKAQDAYGNTMSIEDWTAWTGREHDPANGDSIFDFPGGAGRQ